MLCPLPPFRVVYSHTSDPSELMKMYSTHNQIEQEPREDYIMSSLVRVYTIVNDGNWTDQADRGGFIVVTLTQFYKRIDFYNNFCCFGVR